MTNREGLNIFGASSMGYALIETNRLDQWRALLQEGIGLHLACADDSKPWHFAWIPTNDGSSFSAATRKTSSPLAGTCVIKPPWTKS